MKTGSIGQALSHHAVFAGLRKTYLARRHRSFDESLHFLDDPPWCPGILQSTEYPGRSAVQNEILSALQRCDWFLVLLSPDSMKSMWVKREVAFALQDPRYEDRIVPLTYRDSDLRSLQWLTLFQMISFGGESQMVVAVCSEYGESV
jgi:hypothetical protein